MRSLTKMAASMILKMAASMILLASSLKPNNFLISYQIFINFTKLDPLNTRQISNIFLNFTR